MNSSGARIAASWFAATRPEGRAAEQTEVASSSTFVAPSNSGSGSAGEGIDARLCPFYHCKPSKAQLRTDPNLRMMARIATGAAGRIVVVDVETNKTEIVEIGAVAVDECGELLGGGDPANFLRSFSKEHSDCSDTGDKVLARCTKQLGMNDAAARSSFFNTLVNPHTAADEAVGGEGGATAWCPHSTRCHGITADVVKDAPTWSEVEPRFRAFVFGRLSTKSVPRSSSEVDEDDGETTVICVAHNIACERRVLPKYATGDMLCTLGAFRALFPGQKATLLDCCNFFGISALGMQLHAALVDAVLTAKLFKCMLEVVADMVADDECGDGCGNNCAGTEEEGQASEECPPKKKHRSDV